MNGRCRWAWALSLRLPSRGRARHQISVGEGLKCAPRESGAETQSDSTRYYEPFRMRTPHQTKIALIAGLGLAIAASTVIAQERAAQGYVPGLGEIMSLQQMRHAKLWLVGSRGNWDLAGYE